MTGPIRILLVDDQPLIRVGFQAILETEPGLEVIGQAGDGAQALRLAAELDPDVICMDVQMPVMDGIAATRALSEAGTRAAVLILTTFDRDDFLFETLQAGASGFLLKTAEAEELIRAVQILGRGDALLAPQVTRRVLQRFTGGPEVSRTLADHASDGRGTTGGTEVLAGGMTTSAPAPGASGAPTDAEAPEGAYSPSAVTGPARGTATARSAQGLPMELTIREHEILLLLARGRSNAEIAAELVVGEATVKTHVSNILMKLQVRDRVHAVIWAYEHGLAGGS